MVYPEVLREEFWADLAQGDVGMRYLGRSVLG